MHITQDYVGVHGRLIAGIEAGIEIEARTHYSSFHTFTAMLPNGELGSTVSDYEPTIYDEETARFMEAKARMRGFGLHAICSMIQIAEDSNVAIHPIDQVTDQTAIIIHADGSVVECSKTRVTCGDTEKTSRTVTSTVDGAVYSLSIARLNGKCVYIKDDVSFDQDPELEKVFNFLLLDIEKDAHALLMNLLCGRVSDIEDSAAVLLKPYIGTSSEEEAKRIMEIVKDRAAASKSATAMGVVAMGPPSEERLQEWLNVLS